MGQAPWEQPIAQSAPAAAPVPAPQADLLSKSAGIVSSIFPGGKLGSAIGSSIAGIGNTVGKLFQGDLQGAADASMAGAKDVNSQFVPAVADTANAALTPSSALIGGPAGTGAAAIAGRVGTNAALGAGLGALNAATNGGSIGKGAAIGGALGGGFSALGEGVNAAVNALPNRLLKQALPKLSPGNEEYALKQTKVGTIASNLEASHSSVANLSQQVQTVLKHPEYANDTGAGDFALKTTINAFPNSEYTPATIISTIKRLVPAQAQLVDKVSNGTATLLEKNTLRQSIDPIVKKAFTDAPQLTAKKEIALQFANALRGEVQAHAPETAPIFANLSKEIDLRNALETMQDRIDNKKALGLYDIVAGLGGFSTLGPVGAAGAIALEKAARSPGVGIAAAKGAKAATKALPVVNKLAAGLKGTAINAASNLGSSGRRQ